VSGAGVQVDLDLQDGDQQGLVTALTPAQLVVVVGKVHLEAATPSGQGDQGSSGQDDQGSPGHNGKGAAKNDDNGPAENGGKGSATNNGKGPATTPVTVQVVVVPPAHVPVAVPVESPSVEQSERLIVSHGDEEVHVKVETVVTDAAAHRLADGFVIGGEHTEEARHVAPVPVATPLPPHEEHLVTAQTAASAYEHILLEPPHEFRDAEARLATVAPPVPLVRVYAVEVEEQATPGPAPRTLGVAADGVVDGGALEQAFNDFLGSLTDLEQTLTSCLIQLGPAPWILMGLALVSTACGVVHRRRRRGRLVGVDGEEVRVDWLAES
jgi:hypothetical protein